MRLVSLRILRAAFLALAVWAATLSPPNVASQTRRSESARWENVIRAFEASDRTNPPPINAILFIGSSSIVRWTNAPAMFPGHVIINRGFGGSQLADSVAFAHRIVIPYRPNVVLLYAGSNDLNAGKPPEQVFNDFKEFVAQVRAALPETRIVYLSIGISPSRAKQIDTVKETNRLIAEHCRSNDVIFADVFQKMVDAGGQPLPELFVADQLHPNGACYERWAAVLRPILDRLDPPPPKKP